MSLIRNEQTKLTATFLNGLAIAIFAVGGLAPLFSNLYNPAGIPALVYLVGAVCFVASVVLHWTARQVLKGLIP